jgi:nucleotide-binding universal stress UspA family protein
MDKNILVAIDDSENAMRAVEFVAKFLVHNGKVTLFNVLQDTAALCSVESPELTPYFLSQRTSFCVLEDKKKELVDKAMQKARSILLDAGFEDKNISIKSNIKKKGIARDIAQEALAGYDLIVIGRKGSSGVKEFFLGSISQKVLHLATDASVLIVN